MAKFTGSFPVSMVKKSVRGEKAPIKAAFDPLASFIIFDNEDGTCTVFGVSKAGNQVDITDVATLTVVSSDLTVLTISAQENMTFKMSATGKLGKSTINASAVWLDGSIGPFSFDLPVEVKSGPVSGVVIVPGVPVPH